MRSSTKRWIIYDQKAIQTENTQRTTDSFTYREESREDTTDKQRSLGVTVTGTVVFLDYDELDVD